MFKKISPQKVQHDSGYIVQVFDRYHVEYIDNEKRAKVEVDFAHVVGVYEESLIQWENGNPLSEKEKPIVLDRICGALEFLGSKVELC